MNKNVEKIRDDLYVKKGRFGYQIIYPPKKDPDLPFTKDNIHWRNFLLGDAQALGMWIVVLLAIGLIWYGSHDMINNCEVTIADLQTEELSCDICNSYLHGYNNNIVSDFNISNTDVGEG